jgi:hypothetical protein
MWEVFPYMLRRGHQDLHLVDSHLQGKSSDVCSINSTIIIIIIVIISSSSSVNLISSISISIINISSINMISSLIISIIIMIRSIIVITMSLLYLLC